VTLGCADILSMPDQFKSHEALNGIMCGKEASSNPLDVPKTVFALLKALVSPLGRCHLVPDTVTAEEVGFYPLCFVLV
jgi:hypothetical protein